MIKLREKGVTLLEVVITVFLVGIMTFGVIISINSYNKTDEYKKLNRYLDEKLRVVAIFNSIQMYEELSSNQCNIVFDNDNFKIIRYDEVIINYDGSKLVDLFNNTVVEFNIIKKIKVKVFNDYLNITIESYLGIDEFKVRWKE